MDIIDNPGGFLSTLYPSLARYFNDQKSHTPALVQENYTLEEAKSKNKITCPFVEIRNISDISRIEEIKIQPGISRLVYYRNICSSIFSQILKTLVLPVDWNFTWAHLQTLENIEKLLGIEACRTGGVIGLIKYLVLTRYYVITIAVSIAVHLIALKKLEKLCGDFHPLVAIFYIAVISTALFVSTVAFNIFADRTGLYFVIGFAAYACNFYEKVWKKPIVNYEEWSKEGGIHEKHSFTIPQNVHIDQDGDDIMETVLEKITREKEPGDETDFRCPFTLSLPQFPVYREVPGSTPGVKVRQYYELTALVNTLRTSGKDKTARPAVFHQFTYDGTLREKIQREAQRVLEEAIQATQHEMNLAKAQ